MPGLRPEDKSIHASLTYAFAPPNQKPYNWINEPPAGQPKSNLANKDYTYHVNDLRTAKGDFGLDRSGFELETIPTGMSYADWSDEEKVRSSYYKEVEELFKTKLGAKKVTIFDHTIRRQSPKDVTVADTPSTRQPVSLVHVDQTPESARNRVKRHDPEDADDLLKGRVRLINVWRPLRGPVYDTPLAVADFRSLDTKADLESSDLIYSETPKHYGETFLVKHNSQHRWYYASQMQPNEILYLKCYDSASEVDAPRDGIASLTPHTAFKDLRYFNAEGVAPRESIEIRALVYSD